MCRKLISFLVAIMLSLSVCPFVVYGVEGEEVVSNGDVLAEDLDKVYSDVVEDDVIIVLDEINEEKVEEINLDDIDFRVDEFKFNIQSDLNNLRRPKEKLDYNGVLEITGSIHYPVVQKYDKVFFFIHGRMRYNPFAHHGFDYIIERLNYEGYRVISLNISSIYHSPEAVLGEINAVKLAVNKTLNFIDKNKVEFGDITNLSFIGHSRAGFHIFKIAEDLLKKGYTIENMLSIAPYMMEWDDFSFPDIETTIIVPEFDGDVDDLDGYKLYDEGTKIDRKSVLRCIYLYGGNHNFFSREMTNDDTEYLKLGDNYSKYRLSRELQENFLKEFVLRFMTNEDNCDIMIKASYNCREYNSEYKIKKLKNFAITFDNANMETVYVDKDSMLKNDITWFMEPGYESNWYNVLSFNGEDSQIVFDILNNRKYSDIMFEIALDSTRTILKDIKIEIVVNYTNKVVDIFSINPFEVVGEEIEVDELEAYWSREIPFEQFYLDVRDEYYIDKVILKCNKEAQVILGDIFMKSTQIQ